MSLFIFALFAGVPIIVALILMVGSREPTNTDMPVAYAGKEG